MAPLVLHRDEPPAPQWTFASCVSSEAPKSPLYAACFARGTNLFATAGGRRVFVYEVHDVTSVVHAVQAFVDEDVGEDFYTACFAGDLLCVAGNRALIKVLDVGTGNLTAVMTGHGGHIYELAVHPLDPELLFSCSKDESLGLWSIDEQRRIVIFAGDQGHRDAVLSLDVTDGWMVSGGMDNTVRVWALDDVVTNAVADCRAKKADYRACFVQFPAFITRRVHSDYVDCVRWLGEFIVSKSVEGRVMLWQPDKRRRADAVCVVNQYEYDDTGFWFVHFGLTWNGDTMAVCGKQGVIYIFDVDSGELLGTVTHPRLKDTVRQILFSDDGKSMVASECPTDKAGMVWSWRLQP